MRASGRIAKGAIISTVIVMLGLLAWLYFAPPDLIRVGAGYAAKIVCSNVFVAGRDPEDALREDVQAPGHPLLRLVDVDIDRVAGTAKAALLGVFAPMTAVARPGTGCANVHQDTIATARLAASAPVVVPTSGGRSWPAEASTETRTPTAIDPIVENERLSGPGMRAIVVVHRGRLAVERYGVGFSAATPLLGWSMTKTVTAAIIGTLVREQRLTLDGDHLDADWEDDARSRIAVSDLLSMTSGLDFEEEYGDVTDVTRMLYLERDMAGFAAAKEAVAEAGARFDYSSGTTVVLSRIWQDTFPSQDDALAWPCKALFDPLGMDSAVLETDAAGTFVGSSYLYATARDWARFGQFLLDDGRVDDERILPEGFVSWMREPVGASGGDYGRGHLWLRGPTAGTPDGEDPDAGFDLPKDTFWLIGHDGQSIAVIPSRELVVVRLGLTPSRLGYKPQGLVAAIAAALQ